MMKFEFFWKNSKILLFLIPALNGCSNTPTKPTIEGTANEVPITNIGFNSYFEDSVAQKAVSGPHKSADFFKAYCSDGKQIRDLKYQIRVVIPNPPAGLPIDKAGILRANVSKQLKTHAKNFFVSLHHYDLEEQRKSFHELNNETYDLRTSSELSTSEGVEALSKAGLSLLKAEADKNVGWAQSVLNSLTQTRDYTISDVKREKYNGSSSADEVVYIKPEPSKPIILTANYFRWNWDYDGYIQLPRKAWIGQSFMKSDESPLGSEKQVLLKAGYPGEAAFLMGAFTFLVPPSAFEKVLESDADDAIARHEVFEDNKTQPKISVTKAIEKRAEMWDSYAQKFTTFREAATNDPRIWSYEVSLDLNAFCVYGRALDELVSH